MKCTYKTVATICIAILLTGAIAYSITRKTTPKPSVKISIGYQTPTAQTWSALIIKNQKLYEKYLHEADPNTDYQIMWEDFTSGPPITNNMMAKKIQIGIMGDMPLLINASKGQHSQNYQSVIIAIDGKGDKGKNQGIMTNIQNNITANDLRGKEVSTIFGSSAHRMLLSILSKYNLLDSVTIVNQDVATGMTSVEQNKIIAHATWDPYPRYMVSRGKAKYLVDGSESGVDYLDGIIVNKSWAEQNKVQVVAFAKALIKAHEFIRTNPENAAQIFSIESKFPYEVCLMEAKQIRWDAYIYDRDFKTFSDNISFLKSLGKLDDFDLKKSIDTSYLQQAAKGLHIPYLDSKNLGGDWLADGQL